MCFGDADLGFSFAFEIALLRVGRFFMRLLWRKCLEVPLLDKYAEFELDCSTPGNCKPACPRTTR